MVVYFHLDSNRKFVYNCCQCPAFHLYVATHHCSNIHFTEF